MAQRLDGAGGVLSLDLYDAFGSRVSTGNAADVFGYGAQWGYQTDAETGLVLCTHRYYDPNNGRWLTRDPIGYGGGINQYSYCRNNPVNWADPLGLWTVGIGMSGGILGGVLGIGGGYGIKIDGTGSIAVYGNLEGRAGIGLSLDGGPTLNWSPGNLKPTPDGSGVVMDGGRYVGGSVAAGAPIGAGVSVTVPWVGPHTPTVSISPAAGGSISVSGGVGGYMGLNIPTAIRRFPDLIPHIPPGVFPRVGELPNHSGADSARDRECSPKTSGHSH